MPVTLKDVALRAGVSRSAVSRTFTEGASVSQKTRRKVEHAAEELGYHPNALASSLTTGRTGLIGLVINNFHNPVFPEVCDRFTRGLQKRGLRPLLVNLTDETEPANPVRTFRQYSVDGVIVASSTLPPEFAKAFHDAGMPVVHSFGRQTGTPEVHVVGIDNIACGRMAARELARRGYRRVGFMGGPAMATSTQDRYAGFRDEMAKHPDIGVSFSFADAYSFEAGRGEMSRLLKHRPAEAYFCGDDILSIGAMSAVVAAGRSVPGDIGLIGLNDIEMARWESIELTTIRQPLGRIIATSIETVTSLLKDPEMKPAVSLCPCHVVTRGSLRPSRPGSPDPEHRRAGVDPGAVRLR